MNHVATDELDRTPSQSGIAWTRASGPSVMSREQAFAGMLGVITSLTETQTKGTPKVN